MAAPHDHTPLDIAGAGLHTRAQHPTSSMEPPHTALATAPIVCVECMHPWVTAGERWRLLVIDEDPPETVPYCPACAMREFGAPR